MGLTPFWPHKFRFKPLLGLEPMTPMLPQLLVSHANHSATETSMYVCMYVCMYVYVCVFTIYLFISIYLSGVGICVWFYLGMLERSLFDVVS